MNPRADMYQGVDFEPPQPDKTPIPREKYPYIALMQLNQALLSRLQETSSNFSLTPRHVDMWIFQDRVRQDFAALGHINGETGLFVFRKGKNVLTPDCKWISTFAPNHDYQVKIVNPVTMDTYQPENLTLDVYSSTNGLQTLFGETIYASNRALLLQLPFHIGEGEYNAGQMYDKAFLTNLTRAAVECTTIDAHL